MVRYLLIHQKVFTGAADGVEKGVIALLWVGRRRRWTHSPAGSSSTASILVPPISIPRCNIVTSGNQTPASAPGRGTR